MCECFALRTAADAALAFFAPHRLAAACCAAPYVPFFRERRAVEPRPHVWANFIHWCMLLCCIAGRCGSILAL